MATVNVPASGSDVGALPPRFNAQEEPVQRSLRSNGAVVERAAAQAPSVATASAALNAVPASTDASQIVMEPAVRMTSVTTKARHGPCRCTRISTGGAPRMQPVGNPTRSHHTRLKTNVPLVPPNPKLFLTAYSIFMSRASFAQ